MTRLQPAAKYTSADLMENVMVHVMQLLVSLRSHHIYSRTDFPNTEQQFQTAVSALVGKCHHQPVIDFWMWVSKGLWTAITSADERIPGREY